MISAEQIKAARAMLSWSQDELAKAAGLSLNTICNLENGHRSLRSSLEVRKALESKGFEFIGTRGLNRRSDEHHTYGGADGRDMFYDDMLATVRERRCDVAATFETSEILADALGAVANPGRLEELSKFTRVRCLLSDIRNSSLSIPQVEFRAIPRHPLAPMSLLMYGDKTALIACDGAEFTYFVMKSTVIAQRGWKRFEPDWDAAIPLPASDTTSKRRAAE